MNTMHTLGMALLLVSASVAAWAGAPATDDVADRAIGHAEESGHGSLDEAADAGHDVLDTGADAGRAVAEEAFGAADEAGATAKDGVDLAQTLADEASTRAGKLAADVGDRADEEVDWVAQGVEDRAPDSSPCGTLKDGAGHCISAY